MKLSNKKSLIACLALLAISCISTGSLAQTTAPLEPAMTGFLEAGAGHAVLTGNNPDWNDQYLRGNLNLNPSDHLNAEISEQRHFGDRGTFVGASYTHEFNDTWYSLLSAGTSEGGFFLPKLRVDGFIYRKWLEKKNLVTHIGFMYYKAKETYIDRALQLGASYYFQAPWIVEAGVHLTQSNPGGIRSSRGFVAVTYGENKRHYLTLAYDTGRESYQLTGENSLLSDFASHETSLTWRQWVSNNYGFNLRASQYKNPNYRRTGFTLGIFRDF